ncbi:MAG: DUF2914 domain-containing protein [Candidatus Nomurabacteria bacterium]|nr:DUF2914 domain-containing protein [Candidatus Nomurabacteria bacterium]USN88210.1 MAG: DUF2914 domain-containing protein [Candidatus Nomurabacteria bacterium]
MENFDEKLIEPKTGRLARFAKSHWLTVVFLFGFVTDYLLLNRIDDKLDNFILLTYVVLATASLLLFYLGVAGRLGDWWTAKLRHYMPMLMQYSFGGLLSGMLIFYGRSGDFISSAPFFALIIGVIAVNELVKKQSERLVYNLAVYFVGVFSYFVLVVPVLVGEMSNLIFFGSGLLALLDVSLTIHTLSRIIPNFINLQKRLLVFTIASLYAVFNGFYFLNIIPPIPLSLTELNIYQSVDRSSLGDYRITKEKQSWFEYLPFVPDYFHPVAGQGATCFARVYAPTKLTTEIVHRWEYVDKNGDWQEHFSRSYKITGENKNGYRGYTTVTSVHDGKWRCIVENKRGQVLGKKTFVIDSTKSPQGLVTVVE